ncbi:hypothetical protein XSR1_50113 [Xenorhabdus szentirmaii DSM 16338]|uniref:Uncharacterized protein n=1 Tax=Xenorhabdus szentirmaii DSM 16338 TaxID=1427518 RepID=W1J4C6_9GAMM|nr:hypothetical protein XSR1_50113 [Xenorhabdus szentirmaii DSM 16338]
MARYNFILLEAVARFWHTLVEQKIGMKLNNVAAASRKKGFAKMIVIFCDTL